MITTIQHNNNHPHQALHSSFAAPKHAFERRASLPETSIHIIDTNQELLENGVNSNEHHSQDFKEAQQNCDGIIVFDEAESNNSNSENASKDASPQQKQPQIELTKQKSEYKSNSDSEGASPVVEIKPEMNGSVVINIPLKEAASKQIRSKSASKVFPQPQQQQQPATLTSDPETPERVCRVCLDGDCSEETGELENCCACNGSLKYVHRECLFMQLENKLKHKLEGLKRNGEECTKTGGSLFELNCELCQQTYRLSMHIDKSWCAWSDFKKNLQSNKETFVGSLILLFACLAVSLMLLVEILTTDSFHSALFAQFSLYFSLFGFIIGVGLLAHTLYKSGHVEHIRLTKLFPDMETYSQFNKLHRDQDSFFFPPSLEGKLEQHE